MDLLLFQLPYFTKTADELTSDLDLWPYVLNNGRALNLRALPGKLRVAEIEEALEARAMLTQAFCELPSWPVFLKDSTASVEDACLPFLCFSVAMRSPDASC